jgi:hypothetical protein
MDKREMIIENCLFLNESTIFSRDITPEQNESIRDTLLAFNTDVYSYLKERGLNKYITMNDGKKFGPIHIKSTEDKINKNYNKIKNNRRGHYDFEFLHCNVDDEKICLELRDVCYDFVKKYNSLLPDIGVRILPQYVVTGSKTSTKVGGKADVHVLGAVGGDVSTSTESSSTYYQFWIKCESDTFKIKHK